MSRPQRTSLSDTLKRWRKEDGIIIDPTDNGCWACIFCLLKCKWKSRPSLIENHLKGMNHLANKGKNSQNMSKDPRKLNIRHRTGAAGGEEPRTKRRSGGGGGGNSRSGGGGNSRSGGGGNNRSSGGGNRSRSSGNGGNRSGGNGGRAPPSRDNSNFREGIFLKIFVLRILIRIKKSEKKG